MKPYKIFLCLILFVLVIFIYSSTNYAQHSYTFFLGIPVTITAYNSVNSQTDSTPNITASNKNVTLGMIALSRDLEKDFGFKFGDLVTIYNIGVFEFEDRMNKRWKRRVDILMNCKKEAKEFGKIRGWIVLKKIKTEKNMLSLNLVEETDYENKKRNRGKVSTRRIP